MFELKGKTCLVTGGASGIGQACVKNLLRNDVKGVALVDVNVNSALEVLKEVRNEFDENKVIFIEADVSNKPQFEDAFKKTIETFGNIDVLVNNAGIFQEQQWEKMIKINLNGVIHGCMLGFENYIPKYRSGSEGVIINICSTASVEITGFDPMYTAAKHAALGFSRSLGIEEHYNRTKVKVISVCPSATDTRLLNVNENNFLSKHYFNLYPQVESRLIVQSSTHVAECIAKFIENANTGSVWLIESNEEPYELHIPSRQEMRK